MSTLPSQISTLSIADNFESLDALWQDTEANSPSPTEEQSAELDRHMTKYEQDPTTVFPWEQVKADLFQQ